MYSDKFFYSVKKIQKIYYICAKFSRAITLYIYIFFLHATFSYKDNRGYY